jgi:dihydrofolate reductase
LAASHQSKLVDLTTWFSEWMAGQKYAEGYFTSPEDLQTLVEAEFKMYVADRLRKELEAADAETVVSVIGIGSLYGFLKTSELIRAVEPSIKGRMTVFFPGTKDSNNYRMLDAHDGWNYMANGISLNA